VCVIIVGVWVARQISVYTDNKVLSNLKNIAISLNEQKTPNISNDVITFIARCFMALRLVIIKFKIVLLFDFPFIWIAQCFKSFWLKKNKNNKKQ